MSMFYGKATFRDGEESFLVHDDSRGWALQPLFDSLDSAREWVKNGCPVMDKTDPDSVRMARFSEEPVHVLIASLDPSETQHLNFYTTASRSGGVITGPQSKEDALGFYVDTYTKEYFDSWTSKSDVKNGVENFDSLSQSKKELVDSVLAWWLKAQYLNRGDRGEWNVFDRDPEFVTVAELIRSPSVQETFGRVCTTDEVAKLSVKWWDDFNNDDGGRNIFHHTPDFVELAKKFIKPEAEKSLEF